MLQDLRTLADLCELGGGVASAMFAEALETVKNDLEQRAGVEANREIQLIVRMKPKVTTKGAMGDVELELEVKTKGPPMRSATYALQLVQGELSFNAESPDNAQQLTLDEEAERTAEKRRLRT